MRKLGLILALTLGLGACTNLQNAYNTLTSVSVSDQQVYIARNAFDTIEVTATNYIVYCKTNPTTPGCSKAAIAQLIPAVRSGRVARNNLTQFQKDNPGALGPAGLYNALVTATNTLQTISNQYNITGVVK